MTAATAESLYGVGASPFAFSEQLQEKANKVFSYVLGAVFPALESTRGHTDRLQKTISIAEINRSLRRIALTLPELVDKANLRLQDINADIDRVSIGSNKIDPQGNYATMFGLLLTILEQTVEINASARQAIEQSPDANNSLQETAQLLASIGESFARIHDIYSDIAERIAIHDAMTERPIPVAGIPELDSLNAS